MVAGARSALGNKSARSRRPAHRETRRPARVHCARRHRLFRRRSGAALSAVAVPTAATSTDPRARASRSAPMKLSTATTDVRTTQSFSCTAVAAAAARRPRPRVRPGASAAVPAPSHRRGRALRRGRVPARRYGSPPRCARPAGLDRGQGGVLPEAATGPTTMMAGEPSSTSARPRSVVRLTCWGRGRPTGDDGDRRLGARPPLISAAAMAARVAMPMRMTSVPPRGPGRPSRARWCRPPRRRVPSPP